MQQSFFFVGMGIQTDNRIQNTDKYLPKNDTKGEYFK